MKQLLCIALATALSACAPAIAETSAETAQASAELDSAINRIFAPYNGESDDMAASWERPIYSRAMQQLLSEWEAILPEGEVTELTSGDWLCQCQDWDDNEFKVTDRKFTPLGESRVETSMLIHIGWGSSARAKMNLVKEDGKWLIDDLYTEYNGEGLRTAIRQEMAELRANQ